MTIYEEQLMLDLLKCNPNADKPAKTRRTFNDGIDGPMTKQARQNFKMEYGYEPTERNLRLSIAERVPAIEEDSLSFDELIDETFPDEDWWNGIHHFTRGEMACKCGKCGGFPVEPERQLMEIADELREHFDTVVTINSGVRCEAHNKAVGGVAGSRHKLGKAMDFVVQGVSGSIVKMYCDKLIKAGRLRYCYIISGNAVHMDIP